MAYKPTPPTMDPRQKEPVLSSSSDIPAYIGKPKPQAPKNRIGYSPGGGMVDPASLRRAPRVTQILPGQGMGPMPVGTKPLPMPTVRGSWEDPNYDRAGGMGGPRDNNAGRLSQIAIANGLMDDRGGMQGMKPGGGLEDWIKSHPNGPIYDEWPGSWNRGPVLSTGDNRLNRGDMGPSWNDREKIGRAHV